MSSVPKKTPSKDKAVRPLTTTTARATYDWLQATSEAPHASLRLAFAIGIRLRASSFPPSFLQLTKSIATIDVLLHFRAIPKALFIAHHQRAPAGPATQAGEILAALSFIAHSGYPPPPPQQARGALPPRNDPFQITMTGN
jgi:hypothetical protein